MSEAERETISEVGPDISIAWSGTLASGLAIGYVCQYKARASQDSDVAVVDRCRGRNCTGRNLS